MTHLKTILRASYLALTVLALLSAPIGAMYGYLAWQDARSSSFETVDIARALKSLQTMSEQELAQRERDHAIQSGLLEAVAKMLRESERTRLGIERLVELNTQRGQSVRKVRQGQRLPWASAGSCGRC